MLSPFAAAALSSDGSIIGEPPKNHGHSWQLPSAASAAVAAAASAEPGAVTHARRLLSAPGVAGDCAPVQSTAVAAAAAAEGTSSSQAAAKPGAADVAAATPAATSGAGAAPRKLFVREYDMGTLIREYPLTAEEIKMIFGFLWPKQNKVRRGCSVCGFMLVCFGQQLCFGRRQGVGAFCHE